MNAAPDKAADRRQPSLRGVAFAHLPPHGSGMRIGLFGGTFNPPHAGHRLASLTALRRLGLDSVWWLVTPGNPLKNTAGLPSLEDRMAAARARAGDPRIRVTDLEASLGTRYTIDLLRALRRACPGVDFVWIMGSDNLVQLDRWRRWQDIARLATIAVVDRPGTTLKATASRAGHWLSRARLEEASARRGAPLQPPGLVILHGPRSPLSSTGLRQQAISGT